MLNHIFELWQQIFLLLSRHFLSLPLDGSLRTQQQVLVGLRVYVHEQSVCVDVDFSFGYHGDVGHS